LHSLSSLSQHQKTNYMYFMIENSDLPFLKTVFCYLNSFCALTLMDDF
jgi:hypothetical protein